MEIHGQITDDCRKQFEKIASKYIKKIKIILSMMIIKIRNIKHYQINNNKVHTFEEIVQFYQVLKTFSNDTTENFYYVDNELTENFNKFKQKYNGGVHNEDNIEIHEHGINSSGSELFKGDIKIELTADNVMIHDRLYSCTSEDQNNVRDEITRHFLESADWDAATEILENNLMLSLNIKEENNLLNSSNNTVWEEEDAVANPNETETSRENNINEIQCENCNLSDHQQSDDIGLLLTDAESEEKNEYYMDQLLAIDPFISSEDSEISDNDLENIEDNMYTKPNDPEFPPEGKIINALDKFYKQEKEINAQYLEQFNDQKLLQICQVVIKDIQKYPEKLTDKKTEESNVTDTQGQLIDRLTNLSTLKRKTLDDKSDSEKSDRSIQLERKKSKCDDSSESEESNISSDILSDCYDELYYDSDNSINSSIIESSQDNDLNMLSDSSCSSKCSEENEEKHKKRKDSDKQKSEKEEQDIDKEGEHTEGEYTEDEADDKSKPSWLNDPLLRDPLRTSEDSDDKLTTKNKISNNPDNPTYLISSDEDDVIIQESETSLSKKGRKNIRNLISDEDLTESSKEANKLERERIERLQKQSQNYNEIESQKFSSGLVPDRLVLEYNLETQEPVISVSSELTDKLKPHQKDGIRFMWNTCFETVKTTLNEKKGSGCVLAHCMGLGKTLQVIALVDTLFSHPILNIKRVLILAPSNIVLNWNFEIDRWIPDNKFKIHCLVQKLDKRIIILQHWLKYGGICIMSYTLFRNMLTSVYKKNEQNFTNNQADFKKLYENTLQDPGPDLLVCDEGHMLKNKMTQITKLINRVRTGRKIMLTGTPMQNNLNEYYTMVNLVKPNLLGSYTEYNNRFVNPITNGQHRDSNQYDINLMKRRSHVLHDIVSGVVQRVEKSVLEECLPPLNHYILSVKLSEIQATLYKHYVNNLTFEKNKSLFKNYNSLMDIWLHPISLTMVNKKVILEENELTTRPEWWHGVFTRRELSNFYASSKLPILFHIMNESDAVGDKLLVYTTSLNTLCAIDYFLSKGPEESNLNKRWIKNIDYYRLDGSKSKKTRHDVCNKFNEESSNIKMLTLSIKACGMGINMTAANRVVILDVPWNPALDTQSIFRVYRYGQTKPCYVYTLVSKGTMEQKIYERSVTKQAVACRVIDELQINRHYDCADIQKLYEYTDTDTERPVPILPNDRILATTLQNFSSYVWGYHVHNELLQNQSQEELSLEERAAAWKEFKEEEERKNTVVLPMLNSFIQFPTTSNKNIEYIPSKLPMNVPRNYIQIDSIQEAIENVVRESGDIIDLTEFMNAYIDDSTGMISNNEDLFEAEQ